MAIVRDRRFARVLDGLAGLGFQPLNPFGLGRYSYPCWRSIASLMATTMSTAKARVDLARQNRCK
jgi:hypothetical protein